MQVSFYVPLIAVLPRIYMCLCDSDLSSLNHNEAEKSRMDYMRGVDVWALAGFAGDAQDGSASSARE